MQETFNKLLKRSLNLSSSTVGDPFEVIPVKNLKYAKDCIEIHLGDRDLQDIVNFDKFPNLECLWLNNNKFEKVDGLDNNFRLRELYLHNNKLKTLEGSIPKLLHVRTLTLAHNEIRDLDKNLDILEKFTQLRQLDLSDNPVAEEPNYRKRVILSIPSLHVLDNHVVTVEERAQAKEWFVTEIKGEAAKKKKRATTAWTASKTEKNLDREAKDILTKYTAEQAEKNKQENEELKTRFNKWYNTGRAPTAPYLTESRAKRRVLPITEWEKNYLLPLFKVYDKEKKGVLKCADAQSLYSDLIEDKGCIGLVPVSTFEKFCQAMNLSIESATSITWNDFRIKLNDLEWSKADPKKTQDRIAEYYKEANKLIFMGKPAQAPELLHKASRLENALSK